MSLSKSLATSFLVIRVFDEDEGPCIYTIPSFWVVNGECHLPPKGIEAKAERQEMFKGNWSQNPVEVLSNHSKYQQRIPTFLLPDFFFSFR